MELYNPLGGRHDLPDTHSTEETEAQRGYGVCLNYTASSTAEPERTAVSVTPRVHFLPPMCAPQVVESEQGLRQHAQLTAPVRMEKLSLLEREGFRQREKLGGQG